MSTVFKPKNPNWFYDLVNIPNLELIQKEFIDFFWASYKDKIPVTGFYFIKNLEKFTQFKIFLDSKGLGHKTCLASFSITCRSETFPVHVDYVNNETFLALNIPLINCENSYIVWYEADLENKLLLSDEKVLFSDDIVSGQPIYESGNSMTCKNSTEILRTESVIPMLIHVGRPHRPIVEHENLRVLASIRFRPELTDEEIKLII
jgi:hypothetical protein